MQAIQTTLFDYAALDAETRIVVQQRTTEIKALMKRAASDIIEIGQKLIDVKERLGHGYFGGWLASEFDWTPRTAQQFMLVADTFKNENFSHLNVAPSALYLLAAPSTPEAARIEAIARAEEGEPITHSLARGIVHDHRQPADSFEDDEELTPYEQEIAAQHTEWITTEQNSPEDTEERASHMKPKINRAGDTTEASNYDSCQTPGYAIDPLLRYLPEGWRIWEPACGENMLVDAFYDAGYNVVSSDVITGSNFFDFEPDEWDCLITNPPYSIKYPWLKRCYELGKPFALLMPVETIGAKAAQVLMEEYGVQIIFLNRRVNFKMPSKGFDGGGAQFPVAWFTWGLDLETQIVFGKLP